MKDFLFRNRKKAHVIAIPILLTVILITIFIIDNTIKEHIARLKVLSSPFLISKKIVYPYIKKSVLGTSTDKKIPSFSAEAAVAMDSDSKVILFAKNDNLRFSMASTTKIMTALVAMEYFKPTDILIVKEEFLEGAVVGFKKGEQFTFLDVLYAMLLPSGNDAAFTIAQNYPEGIEAFVRKMNDKAQSLYLYNTHFSDPAGLTDEEDYTTARDLALLSSSALKNKLFSEIVSTKHRTISDIKWGNKYSLYNLNKLLGSFGITGIKTGFTEEAYGVLVTSKQEKDIWGKEHTIIFVVMRSKDRFFDTKQLVNMISGNVIFKPVYYLSE